MAALCLWYHSSFATLQVWAWLVWLATGSFCRWWWLAQSDPLTIQLTLYCSTSAGHALRTSWNKVSLSRPTLLPLRHRWLPSCSVIFALGAMYWEYCAHPVNPLFWRDRQPNSFGSRTQGPLFTEIGEHFCRYQRAASSVFWLHPRNPCLDSGSMHEGKTKERSRGRAVNNLWSSFLSVSYQGE